jgi:predicted O-methyltransferase YrrM
MSTKPEKYRNIHGWFDYEDLYEQTFSNLPQSAHIVEVGCWLGRSACFMAELIKSSEKSVRFDCVDTWRPPVPELRHVVSGNGNTLVDDFVRNLNDALVLEYVNVIQTTSLEVVNMYTDKSLDFVFLDNEHTEEHVFLELNAWWPKIKSGGILAGHDFAEIEWPGVVIAVNRFCKSKRKKFEVVSNSFLIRK